MKTIQKIIEFFETHKRAKHNRNARRYYKALYEFKREELNRASDQIKELKERITLLMQENQSYISDAIHLRGKIASLENQIRPFKKNRFKKGNIPWNKGKKTEQTKTP